MIWLILWFGGKRLECFPSSHFLTAETVLMVLCAALSDLVVLSQATFILDSRQTFVIWPVSPCDRVLKQWSKSI